MEILKKTVIVLTFLLLFPTAVFSVSTWDRAVDIFGRFDELKPHRMKIYSETYDGRGRLEKTEEQIYSLSYRDNPDEPERELLKAVEDGKDITEKKRKELAKNSGRRGGPPGGEDMEGMDRHPFDPVIQQDVVSFFNGSREFKNGRNCEVWNFEMIMNDKYTAVGTAWLDPESGEAVSLEYYIKPLFPFVEEMNIGMDFKTDSTNRWFLEELKMAGRVNMIIMKKSFDSVMSFSDYR